MLITFQVLLKSKKELSIILGKTEQLNLTGGHGLPLKVTVPLPTT